MEALYILLLIILVVCLYAGFEVYKLLKMDFDISFEFEDFDEKKVDDQQK